MDQTSPKTPQSSLLQLGKCLKPHGLKGGAILQLFNGENSSLKKGQLLTLFPLSEKSSLPPEGKILKLVSLSLGPRSIGYFEGIEDRNALEAVLPFSVHLSRKDLPSLNEDGEFYLMDLLGLPVFEHESEKKVGTIKDFYDNGAQTVLIIETFQGGSKELDLPFIEPFFPVVDLQRGRIEVRLPQFLE